MTRRHFIVLLLCLIGLGLVAPTPTYATLPNQTIWDLRTTGSDSNGGGFVLGASGTDRSQSDTAFCNATDLVLVTADTATSATCPFSAASVGNIINVTAGTNFTVQRCAVASVATVTATLTCEGAHAGTSGATGGSFFLGGALLTPQTAITPMNATNFNVLYVKTGTYTVTSAISIGPNGQSPVVEGYVSTHGDLHNASTLSASAPVWTTATNSINLVVFTSSDTPQITFRQMVFSTTAGTPGHGFYPSSSRANTMLTFDRCKFSGFDYAIDGEYSGGFFWTNLFVLKSEFTGITQNAIQNAGTNWIVGCNFHDNPGTAYLGHGGPGNYIPTTLLFNIFNNNNTGAGGFPGTVFINTAQGGGEPAGSLIYGNIFYNNQSNALNINAGSNEYVVLGNIFEGNVKAVTAALVSNNLNGNNTLYTSINSYHNNTANTSCAGLGYICTDSTDTFPSASPFTNAGANDFTLNSTAGGGALLKGVGYIGVVPLGGTGYQDVGPLQSIAAAASSRNFACVQ